MPLQRRPRRFECLTKQIRENACKSIMEIGIGVAAHSKQMICAALETMGDVDYYGFDLFGDITDEIKKIEASPQPGSMEAVRKYLEGGGVNIYLYRGFTKDTLPEFIETGIKPDLIFIDGGHSRETVWNDWTCVKKMMSDKTMVIFDDYLSEYEKLGWGCNCVIDSLKGYKVEFLEPADSYIFNYYGNSENMIASTSQLVKVENG